MVVDRVEEMLRFFASLRMTCLPLVVGFMAFCAATPGGCQDAPTVVYGNISLKVGYVGSKACGTCHAPIYESYLKTDMGRSMALPADPDQLARIPSRVTVHDSKLNRYFETFRQGSEIFQSEYELASNGTEVFRNTQKIAYVIGSGANGVGYIVRQGGYLVEAPLSYYTESKSWALSPGYELGDYGFSRTVAAGCIVCHSGQPQPAPGDYGRYNDPPLRELPIACESCHGPGELHVRERTKAAPLAGSTDTSIVNPAKLSAWLADNICMNCHQASDTRVLQPGKTYSDFRPGGPLEDTVAIFALPLTPASPPASPLLEHFSLMKLSKCFTASGGRMSCLTCHDPHVQPRVNAAAYYRDRCLACHTEKSCPLPLRVRNRNTPPDDCAGCHMPRRSLTLISHAVLTDHRIVRDRTEPYPEAAFHQTTPDLPDLVHVNAVPGSKQPLPPLTVFRAYGDLLAAHPELRAAYSRLLDQLARTDPDNLDVLSALGSRSMSEGTPESKDAAVRYFSRAVQLGSSSVSDYQNLGSLLADAGRTQEAITVVETGIKLDPYDERLYKALAVLNISAHRYPQALAAMKKDLELFPEDDFMRSLIEKAQEDGP
ncbi:MAG TPA: hypothetical protein VMT20_10235 [Terriglobia bacterium]|nr:hypothetical protein [Terriglobia bacterium]